MSDMAPSCSMLTLRCFKKLSTTLLKVALLIPLMHAWILVFISATSRVLSLYMLSIQSPHKKKCRWIRLGESGAHIYSIFKLISLSGNVFCNHCKFSFPVLGVAPSGWNHSSRRLRVLLCPSIQQRVVLTQ